MIKKVLLVISIIILPVIFCFLIYIQISQIRKSRDEFNLSEGTVENFGVTKMFYKGGYRSLKSSSEVFFIKLHNNDTLYSYFSRNNDEYLKLNWKIKNGELVKIFNEGFNENKNTINIVELELNKEKLIKKSEFDKRAYILLFLFSLFLVLYFYIPYKFVYLKSKKKYIKIT